jgi:hypothetical protein
VDSKFNAAQAMASFNAVHARELGFIVTKVEKLPSGDWLIKETRPLSPAITAMEGAAQSTREFADRINASLALMDADADAGEDPSSDPGGDDEESAEGDAGSGSAGDGTSEESAAGGGSDQTQFKEGDSQDLGDGNGGQGQKGEGTDARAHDVGPSKPGDAVPDDQSAKEGKAGGTGVGTGSGVTSGAGASALPGPKTGNGAGGKADQPAGGAAPASGGTGGRAREARRHLQWRVWRPRHHAADRQRHAGRRQHATRRQQRKQWRIDRSEADTIGHGPAAAARRHEAGQGS